MSKQNNDIVEKLVDSTTSPELKNLAVEVAEVGLDQLLDEEVLKDLPIVGGFVRAYKTVLSIRDKAFFNKVTRFFVKLSSIPDEEKEKFREDIKSDPKLRRKVGETLFLVLDRLDDLEKPEILAIMFQEYLSNGIEFTHFKRLASAIDIAFIEDLKAFAGLQHEQENFRGDLYEALFKSGLTTVENIESKSVKYSTVKYKSSDLGKLFLRIMLSEIDSNPELNIIYK